MSLARGLDYYTGIIYEAVVEASAPPGITPGEPPASAKKPKKKADGDEEEIDESQVGVGSIAAGGRYDNLVGMFTAAAAAEGKKAASQPCVGISIGLDRIFALVWPKWVEKGMRSKETMVYVMAAGDGLLVERISLVQELRAAGIKVIILHLRLFPVADCDSRLISWQRRSQSSLPSLRQARKMRFRLLL
jgi:histidyl-tRNA synthetase